MNFFEQSNFQNKSDQSPEKERILEVIFTITQSVLERHSHYDVIPDSLAQLGKAIDADRVYYWENKTEAKTGRQLTSQIFEWCRPGISQQIDNSSLRDLPYDIVFDFLEPLKRGCEQNIIVSDLSPSHSQKLLIEQDIVSLLALPVIVNSDFWGFVGFDDCSSEKLWSELELSLLKSYVSILSKSIERNLLEASLIRTKHEAEAASRAKSQFLSGVSHELRTPLNAIMVYTDLLRQSDIYISFSEELDQISNSSTLLLNLINNLLDFSKLESGKAVLNCTDFSLESTVRQAVNQSKAAIGNKNLQISYTLDEKIPSIIRGDSLKISQILLNLLDNAIKFSEKGHVGLHIEVAEETESDTTIIFTVMDTGIGMTAKQAEKIFEPFMQASPEISSNYGGTGLGLSICKNLVELHGGSIWLGSEPGSGTAVSFTIAFGKTSNNQDYKQDNSISGSESDQPASAFQTTVSGRIPAGIKALAVEDNPVNQKVIRAILADTGIELTVAASGRDALDLAISNDFDLVLMDIIMPELNGWETAKLIRKLPGYGKVPIIAVTAGELEPVQLGFRSNLFNAVIGKPLRKDELMEKIADAYAGIVSVQDTVGTTLIASLKSAGINYEDALARFDYDWEFYCELLSQFYRDYSELISLLSRAELTSNADNSDNNTLLRLHSLKGSAAELGALELSNQAAILEAALKTDVSTEVDKIKLDLRRELQVFLNIIQ